MFPTWANNGEMDSTWNMMIASIIFHLNCPIIYNLFCFLNPSYPYKNGFINPIKRIDNKIYSFILWAYLLFYSVYAITINYIQLPAHVYIDGHPRYDLNSSGNPVQLLGLAAMGILYFVIEKLVFAYNNFLTTPVEMRNESLYLNYKYNDSKKAIYEKYCKDALKSIKEIEQNNKK